MALGAIFAIAKTAFGVVKAIDKSPTAQKVMEGIDHLKLTDEERADMFMEYMKLNQDQNSERSKARRELALLWIRYQLSLSTIYIFSKAAEVKWPGGEDGSRFLPFSDAIWKVLELYWWGTAAVLGFFFAAHIVRQVKKK